MSIIVEEEFEKFICKYVEAEVYFEVFEILLVETKREKVCRIETGNQYTSYLCKQLTVLS